MNFDFKVIAKSVPAISLVMTFAGFFLHRPEIGILFLAIFCISFVLMLLNANHDNF